MAQERNDYEVIKKILAEQLKTPCTPKEAVKAKIRDAIGGDNYIKAVTAYLWGAYNHFDPDGKAAFTQIFYDDLKTGNPSAFYFFSFYFLNDFKRTGFDRRTDTDRRKSYSLDFFNDRIIERRQGEDRRKDPEKRANWTRVTKWVSVPFTAEHPVPAGDGIDRRHEKAPRETDSDVVDGLRCNAGLDIRSLNVILSSLILYFECHVKQGQTDWLNNVDEEVFARAKSIMRELVER